MFKHTKESNQWCIWYNNEVGRLVSTEKKAKNLIAKLQKEA